VHKTAGGSHFSSRPCPFSTSSAARRSCCGAGSHSRGCGCGCGCGCAAAHDGAEGGTFGGFAGGGGRRARARATDSCGGGGRRTRARATGTAQRTPVAPGTPRTCPTGGANSAGDRAWARVSSSPGRGRIPPGSSSPPSFPCSLPSGPQRGVACVFAGRGPSPVSFASCAWSLVCTAVGLSAAGCSSSATCCAGEVCSLPASPSDTTRPDVWCVSQLHTALVISAT